MNMQVENTESPPQRLCAYDNYIAIVFVAACIIVFLGSLLAIKNHYIE
jgi:hypothetical protein